MSHRFFHIIGAGRGGTSLLAGLLDAHSDCTVRFEGFSQLYLMDETLAPDVRIDRYLEACRAEAAETGGLWGHKTTTEHILALGPEGVDLFLERTRDVPAIFILRDGRACVASKMVRNNVPLDAAIERWQFSVALFQRMLAEQYAFCAVRFEGLVSQPQTVMSTVCAFLGLEYEAAMLAGTMNEKMAPEYRRSGFDVAPPIQDPPWRDRIDAELRSAGYA